MLDRTINLARILDPITPDDFVADVFDQKPLLVPGADDKFVDVFSWDALNHVMNMTNVWSASNMRLALHGQVVPAADYCVSRMGRDGERIMRPIFPKLEKFLAQGATMNLNYVETLHSGVASVAQAIAMAFVAPVECNVYSSRKDVQAFGPHFDSMDVFVLHIAGEKRWRVYENRFDAPAEAEGYVHSTLSEDFNERFRGDVAMEPLLTPGDFLYIPKGCYHEALSSTDASLHLTFGLMEQRSEDVVRAVVDQLSDDRLFRLTMPHPDDGDAYRQRLADIGARFAEIITAPRNVEYLMRRQKFETFRTVPGFAFPSPQYDQLFRLRRGAAAKATSTDIAADARPLADWILTAEYFEIETLVKTFPDTDIGVVMGLIDTLFEAGAIEPAFPDDDG